jgi:hypothetical protein
MTSGLPAQRIDLLCQKAPGSCWLDVLYSPGMEAHTWK